MPSTGKTDRMLIAILVFVVPVLVAGMLAMTPANAGAQLSLVSQTALPDPGVRNSDIWAWVDPNNGNEYACIGKYPSVGGRVALVDATNPFSPVVVKQIINVPSFDLKIWVDADSVYMYLCDGNASGGNDSQVWNVTNPATPYAVGTFPSCHNIYIDSNGYMYLSYNTLRIYELNTDPRHPTFVWTDARTDGHDVYVDEVTNILYDFHGYAGTFIYNVSGLPAAPVLLGTLPPAGISYHHSGWTSSNHKYLYVNDELGGPTDLDVTVWNVANPAAPVKVSDFFDGNATPHNSFRVGDYLFMSYYVAGVRVFDIGGGATMNLVDAYDTSPAYTGNYVFEGCWGVYPFSPTGYIYASDMQNGFFVFSFTPPTPSGVGDAPPPAFTLEQNYPNPFNPTTTIDYVLPEAGRISLSVYNANGQRVRTLVDETRPAGRQSATWDARDDGGAPVASGVYFYRFEAGGRTETKRMTLLK